MKSFIFRYISTFFLLVSVMTSSAQDVYWDCLKKAGGTERDEAYSIVTDTENNMIVTGFFTGTAEFDEGELNSNGGADIFIAKYDDNIDLLWLKSVGGPGEDKGHAVTTDEFNNIYVTGFFADTAYFEDTSLISGSGIDMFISKFDSDGDLIWALNAASDSGSCGNGIVNYNNELYVTGFFFGTINIGDTTLTSFGDADIYIAKYDITGNFYWARQAGGVNLDVGNDITVDNNGKVFVTGNYREYALFGDSIIPANEICNIFAVCYDNQGNMLWLKYAGGNGSDRGYSICTDESGNVYITGYICFLNDTAYFDTTEIITNGGRDIFLVKYDNNGNMQWVTQTGSKEHDIARSVIADNENNIFLTGCFNDTIYFDDTNIVSAGYNDILVAAYDTDGNVKLIIRAGGGLSDSGESITKDTNNKLRITGFFRETAFAGNDSIVSSGNADIVMLCLIDTNIISVKPAAFTDVYIKVYPNPADRMFNLEISGAGNNEFIADIVDIHGRLLKRYIYSKCNSVRDHFDLTAFSPGIYFAKIICVDPVFSETVKIVVY